jgi:hypothetical protein
MRLTAADKTRASKALMLDEAERKGNAVFQDLRDERNRSERMALNCSRATVFRDTDQPSVDVAKAEWGCFTKGFWFNKPLCGGKILA